MNRRLKNLWFDIVSVLTWWLPDVEPIMAMRGWLARPAFASCGCNFQLARGVNISCTEGLHVGNNVYLAHYVWVQGFGQVTLEDEVVIGPFSVLASRDHCFKDGSVRFGGGVGSPIRIRRGTWLASHVVVTRGVTVGQGCTLAAGAVVVSDVPDFAIVGGVPARVIGSNQAPTPAAAAVGAVAGHECDSGGKA